MLSFVAFLLHHHDQKFKRNLYCEQAVGILARPPFHSRQIRIRFEAVGRRGCFPEFMHSFQQQKTAISILTFFATFQLIRGKQKRLSVLK